MTLTAENTLVDNSSAFNCSSNASSLEDAFNTCNNGSSDNATFRNYIFDRFPEEGTTAYNLFFAYKTWYFIIDVVLILPTVLGNSLIIISLIRFKTLRKTKAFLLIGNLAISDLLVGVVLIPMDLLLLVTESISKDMIFCMWYYCTIYTLITASVLNLFLLSLERFHAIIRPFQHNSTFTAQRVYRIIGVTWSCVIGVGFLPAFLWITGNLGDLELHVECRNAVMVANAYHYTMNAIIVVALGISFGFFIVVIRIALRKSKQIPMNAESDSDNNNHGDRHTLRRDIRHTRLMIIVSGTFVICWTPYCIISLIPENSDLISFIRNWLASLGLINSCLNWIVYGARNKRFRAAFKSILNCSCRRRGEVKITSNST